MFSCSHFIHSDLVLLSLCDTEIFSAFVPGKQKLHFVKKKKTSQEIKAKAEDLFCFVFHVSIDTPFQNDNCDGTVVKTRELFTLESSSAQVLC